MCQLQKGMRGELLCQSDTKGPNGTRKFSMKGVFFEKKLYVLQVYPFIRGESKKAFIDHTIDSTSGTRKHLSNF